MTFFIGSQFHSLPELLQVHKNIELLAAATQGISENFADLYSKGLSLSDIAKQTGMAKTTVRSSLIRNGVELRANVAAPISTAIKTGGKNNAQPYFGFCYFQGELVPHQNEYSTLSLIYNLWKLKSNPNSIANHLNEKKLPPRSASSWNRNSIVNITTRFEDDIITKVNGQLRIEKNMKLKSIRKQRSNK